MTNPLTCIVRQDGQLSEKLIFASKEFVDKRLNIMYKPHRLPIPSLGKSSEDMPATAIHQSCFDDTASKKEDLDPANNITTYAFEPALSEDSRRARWYQGEFAVTLCMELQPRHALPLELLNKIAGYSFKSHAAQSILRRRRELKSGHITGRSAVNEVDVYKDIWVTYTSFEGIKYIQTLANERGPEKSILLRKAESTENEITMYVAEDHLGIRDLLFSDSLNNIPAVQEHEGVWWRTMNRDIRESRLSWQCDVSNSSTHLLYNTNLMKNLRGK